MADAEPDWRPTVHIRPATELDGRWAHPGPVGPRPARITELIDLRPAFYRRVHPLPVDPEEQARLSRGRELHAGLGARLASRPEELEVRVRRDGVVGQVDWLSEVPAELKTTASLPALDALAIERPQYLEQLGMYCALVGTRRGRLLLVPADGAPVDAAVALDVTFSDLEGIWAEAHRRADRLRDALDAQDPGRLPRCAWYSRGCPYRRAQVCGCSGAEPELAPSIVNAVERVERDARTTDALRQALTEVNGEPAPFPDRFTDLITPRRAYYRRSMAPAMEERRWTASPTRVRLFRQIMEGVEAADAGGLGHQLPTRGGVRELVSRMDGRPYLIKITRATPRPTPEAMLADQPQYFLELGLRCQAVGSSSGWLILGYERPPPGAPEIAPFDVRFEPIEPLRRFAEARESALRRAIERRAPHELPACPAWMYRDCPYRAECACGSVEGPNR